MKRDTILTGKFNRYFQWPLYVIALWAALSVALFFIDGKAFVLSVIFLIVYTAAALLLHRHYRRNIAGEMIAFAAAFDRFDRALLEDFALPTALLDGNGVVLWANHGFAQTVGEEKLRDRPVTDYLPELTFDVLPDSADDRTECALVAGGVHYRAAMQRVSAGSLGEDQNLIEADVTDDLIAVYLFDETELFRLMKINEENKIVVGIISIDNFDEAMESMEEVRRSLLLALIDRKITQYFGQYDALIKKFEREHFIFVIRKTKFEEMEKARFSLLEEVKDVKVGNEMAITLSMGIGLNQGSFTKDLDAAQTAIDMALSRGGDQIIIRDNERVTFRGGRTGAVEKYTRVKARVKAHALREIISSKDRVVIMGHKITDLDAVGAAIGLYRAAKTLGKPAHILIDRSSVSIGPLVDEISADRAYEKDLFIDAEQAKEMTDQETVVIVVDTNRPSYTECRALLDKTEALVVLDHHRQGEEVIKNARLSYIEPYASSASEMATEILQYFDEEVKLRSIEADALYAGIMVDTNNFNMRTGVRTFEAAAFLRRNGADITHVRRFFKESLADFRAKAQAIGSAELYMDSYAISVLPSKGLSAPTIASSQTANELLNVAGVKASFVVTEYNGLVYVSARAIDEVNVQIIMERLGGGGHINMAGTQFEESTIEEVIALLKTTIREMKEEGDI